MPPTPSVCFRIRGGYEVVAIDLQGVAAGPLSAPFSCATTRWVDVIDAHLVHVPIDRNCVWRLEKGGASLVIGVDIPLGDALSKWVSDVGDGEEEEVVELLLPGPMHLPISVEYEKMRYALGAFRAGVAWPAWERDDTDPINLQPLGEWENQRDGRAAVGQDQNNGIENLIGLQAPDSRIVKFVNVANLIDAITAGMKAPDHNPHQQMIVRDPAFGSVITDPGYMRDALRSMVRNAKALGAADAGWHMFIWKLGAQADAESKRTGMLPLDSRYLDAFGAENDAMRAQLASANVVQSRKRRERDDAYADLLSAADSELRDAYESELDEDGWGGEPDVQDILDVLHEHDAWALLTAQDRVDFDQRIRRLFAARTTAEEEDTRTPVRHPEMAAAAKQLDDDASRGSLLARYRRSFLLRPHADPSEWMFDAATPVARKRAKDADRSELRALAESVDDVHRRIQHAQLPIRGEDEAIAAFEARMRAYRADRAKELAAIIVPERVTGKLFGRMRIDAD